MNFGCPTVLRHLYPPNVRSVGPPPVLPLSGGRDQVVGAYPTSVIAAGSLPLKGGGQEGVLLDGVCVHWIPAFAGNAFHASRAVRTVGIALVLRRTRSGAALLRMSALVRAMVWGALPPLAGEVDRRVAARRWGRVACTAPATRPHPPSGTSPALRGKSFEGDGPHPKKRKARCCQRAFLCSVRSSE